MSVSYIVLCREKHRCTLVYQKFTSNLLDDREHPTTFPGARFLSEAKYMTGLLLQDATNQLDRIELLNQQKNMVDALEYIWESVEKGDLRVRSIAVLRAAKNVSCAEIEKKIKSPNIDHARVISELRLLINTFEYIIKPELT